MIFTYFVILGVLIGSFFNVVILRLPKNESVIYPNSHCPKCKKSLKFYHNIPIISWIYLRGHCAFCGEKISFQYPLIEFASGVIFAITFLHEKGDLLNALIYGLIFVALLSLCIIDFRYKAVPDKLSLPTLVLALFTNSPMFTIKYALLFAGAFALLRIFVSFFLKKEALGEADIIIAATIGAMFGFPLGALGIYIGALIALVAFVFIKDKNIQIPFIPFLAAGAFSAYVFDSYLLQFIGKFYV